MVRWIFGLLLIASVGLSYAAPADELASAPAGTRATGYLAAFNSGDEAVMRSFISENFADSALAKRDMEARLSLFREMRRDIKHLEMTQVLPSDSGELNVVVHAADRNDLRMSFLHEVRSPYKLLGILVDHPDPAELGMNRTPLSESAALDSIAALLQQRSDSNTFSGVVLIAKKDQPLLRKAYGWADREHRIPNQPDTKFNLGSISKSFTRVAVERLIAEGRINASDTLGKFLPDYPNAEARAKVTVQQLLDHRSGIGDFFGPEFDAAAKDKIRTLQEYVPFFATEPLNFAPGSRERYSNGGFVVLGLIIEKVTGKSYYDYVKEVVFQPAGMKDSEWCDSDQPIPNLAIGYTRRSTTPKGNPSELRSNTLMLPARGSSAGGSYSTADDLLKYVTALQQGTLRSSEGGRIAIAGGSPGVSAAVEAGLRGGYNVIVLCNLDPRVAEQMARVTRFYLNRVKT